MEPLTFHPLIQVTTEDVSLVRGLLDLDEEKIQKSVDAIIEWWKKQEHLVEALPHMERRTIERIFILSQGSLEDSKRKIEKVLTTRGLLPEIVLNKSFEEFQEFLDNVFLVILPKLNPVDHTRIGMINLTTENYQYLNVLTLMRFIFLITELRTIFDYEFSDRYIVDLKNFKAHMLTRLNPIILKKGEIMVSAYGIKIKGIHILNAPPFIDTFLSILKQVLKEKIANRIYVHKSYEELYELVDKEALPEDYGGNLPSCKKLSEQWREYFKTGEGQQILDASNKLYSNESKRSSFKFNEEYLGMPGSFKQLNVD